MAVCAIDCCCFSTPADKLNLQSLMCACVFCRRSVIASFFVLSCCAVFNKNSATTAIWNANAASLGSGSGYKLHVRDDGKLKIVDGKGTQTWST